MKSLSVLVFFLKQLYNKVYRYGIVKKGMDIYAKI